VNAHRFDDVLRSFAAGASRRGLFFGLVTGAMGMALADRRHLAVAKKGKKKKLKRNEFGCVNVGGKCRGNDANCCSAICEGRKPKKGKKDKSRCVAHDVGSCQAGQETCGSAGSCTTSTGFQGTCARTTGQALYCHSVTSPCQACAKDADCVPTHGIGAACVVAVVDIGVVCSGGCGGSNEPTCRGNVVD
jgi:hypothetical protein